MVRILIAYGAVFIPLMLYWVSKWLMEGYELEGIVEAGAEKADRLTEMVKTDGYLLGAVFGGTLGSAVLAHLLIRWLGWVKGLGVFGAFFYGVMLKVVSPWFVKKILRVEAMEGPPVWELDADDEIEVTELIVAIEA